MGSWKRFREGFGFGLLLILLLSAGPAFWLKTHQRTELFLVPNPKLPIPNAHDAYLKAASELVHYNAIHLAGSSLSLYALLRYQRILQQNGSALALIDAGLHQTYFAPPVRSFNTALPYLYSFEQLGELLALRSRILALQHNYQGAVNSALDCVQLGVQILAGAGIQGMLIGGQIQMIGEAALQEEISHLNSLQANSALRRMLRIRFLCIPFYSVLQQQEWFQIAALQEFFNQNKPLNGMFVTYPPRFPSPLQGIADRFKLSAYGGASRIIRRYKRYMDSQIVQDSNNRDSIAPLPPIPSDPINQQLLGSLPQAEHDFLENADKLALITIAIALQEYHLKKGLYPLTLQSLVPIYLKQSILISSSNRGFQYRYLARDSYLLSSNTGFFLGVFDSPVSLQYSGLGTRRRY